MCHSIKMHTTCVQGPSEARRGKAEEVCEPPDMDAGIQTWVLCNTNSYL